MDKEELEEEEKDQISELDVSINMESEKRGVNRFRSFTGVRRIGSRTSRSNSSQGSGSGKSQKSEEGVQVIDDFESDEEEAQQS